MTASSKPAPKTSPHSRFIPREEIGAVAAWHFSAIGGVTEPAPLMEEAPTEPSEVVDLHTHNEALEQAYAEGYAQGHGVGTQEVKAALQASAQQEAEASAKRIAQLLKTMAEDLLDKEQDMARQMLDLACEIARQVVRQEIKTNPRLLRPVIGEALEMIVEDGLPATVRMHPGDLARLQEALKETLGENAPEFIADPQISPGGCVVQSPSSMVDATLEKRWARAVGNLGLSIDWATEPHHE